EEPRAHDVQPTERVCGMKERPARLDGSSLIERRIDRLQLVAPSAVQGREPHTVSEERPDWHGGEPEGVRMIADSGRSADKRELAGACHLQSLSDERCSRRIVRQLCKR